jgi:hypothetical protein
VGLKCKIYKNWTAVDFKETQGLLCKIPGNVDLTNYFPMVKVVDRVHAPMDRERRRPMVYHGHRLGGRLTGDRPKRRPRVRNLTAVEEKWRGDGGEPHRWQQRVAEGRTLPGNGGEQSVEETLGGGGAADSGARD